MNPNQFVLINFIVVFLFLSYVSKAETDQSVEETLKSARKQFYAAIKDKKQIEPTIQLFKRIAQMKPSYTGRTEVYVGALVALKGKHAFLPHAKLKWTKRGLTIMDNGLKKSPSDIEALFIHATHIVRPATTFRSSSDVLMMPSETSRRLSNECHWNGIPMI